MELDHNQLKFFADYIKKELGIIYTAENYFQLEKRLFDISKQLGIADIKSMYTKAQGGISGHFKQLLLDLATNNETSFFRDPKIFKAIENYIIPQICEKFPRLPLIRIWCAASSFGQEPYSLAILLHEMTLKNPKLPRFEIIATDISQAALIRARQGRYTQLEVQRGLPAQMLVKYFSKSQDDMWTLNSDIKITVQFKAQNLLEPLFHMGSCELVLCRNVLIYQSEAKKKEIVEEISKRIPVNGFLVLGAAESLLGVSDKFEQTLKEGAIFFQRKAT